MNNFKENAKIIFQCILDRYNENNIIDTESDFCKEFGISRTIIREIMAVAKLIGAVTTRQGSCPRLKRATRFFRPIFKRSSRNATTNFLAITI